MWKDVVVACIRELFLNLAGRNEANYDKPYSAESMFRPRVEVGISRRKVIIYSLLL
jgi:hypothetical protein